MPCFPIPTPFARAWMAASVCAVALAACGGQDAAPARGAESSVVVTTTSVAVRPFNDRIRALATVKARESVDVTAKVSETVDRVHFESGDDVSAGAPLVTLSGQQQDAALAAARATATEADRLYRRQQELAAQQLIARASLDTQAAMRDSARAQVRQIEANLRDRVIRAPFAGVLGIRQVSAGALVTPGTLIATLDDIARVHVDFPVPEAQLAHVAAGQRVSATSTAWPGRAFEGTVSIVDSRVDPATRAVTVRADFANDARLLRPGMLLQVELERPSRDALLVPEISIVQVGRDSFVYRVKADDTVEQAVIEIGARAAGSAEVIRGLSAGDRIVVDGTGKLRPGLAIREAERAPAAAAPGSGPAAGDDAAVPATAPPGG
jgi:membrane fusion protein (multidrug efflux system)